MADRPPSRGRMEDWANLAKEVLIGGAVGFVVLVGGAFSRVLLEERRARRAAEEAQRAADPLRAYRK